MPQPNFEYLLTVELPGAVAFLHITLKLFRALQLLPIDALPAHYPRGPVTAWHTFWLPSFPRQVHTVLWRYCHHKLSTRQRLYQLCPDRHLDPYCLLRFLQPAARLTYESLDLRLSTPIQVLSELRIDGQIIIACTVWAIWWCHWRFVFDGRTFWPDEAAARATQTIKRIHNENAYKERLKSSRSG